MCGPASGWSKAAFVVLIIAVPLHIAGWATTNWMAYSTTGKSIETNVGLWRMLNCSSGACTDSPVASQYENDGFNAVRGLETVAFCVAVFTIILLGIYMCMVTRQLFAAIIMILCYIAGASSFIGMIIFVTSTPKDFVVSWSMGLTVIAMTLILIAGTLMIPDSFEPDYSHNSKEEEDDEDDFFGTRKRSVVTPMSLRDRPARSMTPISHKGGVEGRWRSY